MKIALDAMGGDFAPEAAVHGAVWAARDYGLTIQLVGKPEAINAELAKHNTAGLDLPVIPASEVIEMDEPPAVAVKTKRDSSMAVALRLVKHKESEAFVTAGNSGGALASALFGLGRVKGIKRPALGTIFPNTSDYGLSFLLDVGANTDVRPEFLLQFAIMGSRYAENVLKIPTPRVGLLSTGEEEEKGNQLIQEVTPMLKREIKARPLAMLGALLARGAIKALRSKLDYREFGGGSLLGVNGVVIIAHGRSDPYAVRHAIRVAKQAAENNIVEAIGRDLPELEPTIG